MSWQAYVPHAVGGTAVSGSLFVMLFRDSIKEWWTQRARDRISLREERLAEKNSGSYLQKELLIVLKQELSSNAALLNKLNDTMVDFKDVMKNHATTMEHMAILVEDVHAHQTWMKWKYGGPQ